MTFVVSGLLFEYFQPENVHRNLLITSAMNVVSYSSFTIAVRLVAHLLTSIKD